MPQLRVSCIHQWKLKRGKMVFVVGHGYILRITQPLIKQIPLQLSWRNVGVISWCRIHSWLLLRDVEGISWIDLELNHFCCIPWLQWKEVVAVFQSIFDICAAIKLTFWITREEGWYNSSNKHLDEDHRNNLDPLLRKDSWGALLSINHSSKFLQDCGN